MNLKAVETRKIMRIRTFPGRKQKKQKEDEIIKKTSDGRSATGLPWWF